MQLKNRFILAFNRFYSNLLKDLKVVNRALIKKNYKVFDKSSTEYVEFFKSQFNTVLEALINDSVSVLETRDDILEKFIVKEFSVKMVIETVGDFDKNVFWNYIFILTLFVLIGEEDDDDLFNVVVNILSKIQQEENVDELVEDSIVDDDIKKVLLKIKTFKGAESVFEETKEKTEFVPPFPGMQDSKICNLAKEISNEIDISNIKLEKPEDVLKLMDFSSGNNLVGDIIKKVSTKIHDKINTGELKQEDLFSEAMSMMSMMNMGKGGGGGADGGGGGGGGAGADMFGGMANMFNNPMMSEMMKAMKKGKAAPRQDIVKKSCARDRLRAKLEEKRK